MDRLTKRQGNRAIIPIERKRGQTFPVENPYQKAIEKLADYEDAEEEGRLVVLPCKVGDTVWFRTFAKNATVDMGVLPHKVSRIAQQIGVEEEFDTTWIPAREFGKTVFLTREEAEAALEKMKGETKWLMLEINLSLRSTRYSNRTEKSCSEPKDSNLWCSIRKDWISWGCFRMNTK